MALKYAMKFDYVSPTWFDIKPETFKGKFNVKVSIYYNNNLDRRV